MGGKPKVKGIEGGRQVTRKNINAYPQTQLTDRKK
jgi:hypothetical protein